MQIELRMVSHFAHVHAHAAALCISTLWSSKWSFVSFPGSEGDGDKLLEYSIDDNPFSVSVHRTNQDGGDAPLFSTNNTQLIFKVWLLVCRGTH